MQRRVLLFLLTVLLVTGSATGVNASTDCQRWFIAYRQQLEHSQAVKRLRLAKVRALRYARMKLAGYVRPKPVARPRRHYSRRPRMTRAEALRRYNLACGVLPEREADQQTLQEEAPADFTPLPLDFLQTTGPDDQALIASESLPTYSETGTSDSPGPGGPPTYGPPGGGFPGSPGGPGHHGGGNPPPGGSNPPPVVVPVPEPESLALLLTGLIGGVGVLRRKIKRLAVS